MSTDGRALLASISARLRPHTRLFAEALVARNIELMPELGGDQLMIDLLTLSMVDNLETGLRILETGAIEGPVLAPPAALEHARRLAQRNVPLSLLLRAYRLGQAGFQQRAIQEMFAATEDPSTIVSASLELSTATFGYVDDIAEQVVAEYQAERDRWMRNGLTLRRTRLLSVLAEGTSDIVDAEESLGYLLRQPHLGVILWADANSRQSDRGPRLERMLVDLADRLGSKRKPLAIPADGSTLWAWIPDPQNSLWPSDANRVVQSEEGLWVAAGELAAGVDGFRRTHRQAHSAMTVALAIPASIRRPITDWAEVGLLALMTSDLEALREWVKQTLGELALADPGHARLRDTLRALLSSQGSFVSASRTLGVHRNTVQYRVERVAEILGPDWRDRRLEIDVALRACQVFGEVVLRQPATSSD